MDELFSTFLSVIDNREDMGKIISIYHDKKASNNSRVKWVFDRMEAHDLLPFEKVFEIKRDKSSEKSIKYRNTGNTLYAKKDWMGALSSYSESIAAAPYPLTEEDNSNELAIAFANRSAVLFAMEKYEACLADIVNALKFDYPDNLIYKLMERQGKCFQHLGKFDVAARSIQKSIDFLPLASSLSKATIDQTLQRLESLYIENYSKYESSPDPQPEPEPKPSEQQPAKSLQELLGSVEVKYKKETGRYLVANRNFMPGEVIVVEDSYAAVLLPGYFSTHCYNCLRRFNTLIPCKMCSLVMFCTDQCQEEAWEKYHKIECLVLSQLLELETELDWMVALRLLLVASNESGGLSCFLKKIKALSDSMKNETCYHKTLKKAFENDPSYTPIHSLVDNSSNRTYKEVLRLTVIVVCIVNCLDVYTDIFSFGTENSDEHTDPRIAAGGLLLQYIQSAQCNSYSMAELLFDTKQGNTVHTITMGGAIYKFSSVINHSCSPNVVRSNHAGSSLNIMASMPIKKGEEICCDYGYQFYNCERAWRKAALAEMYFFDCNCVACKNDWPLSHTLDANKPTFLCPKCKSPLSEEKNPASLLDYGNLVCSSCPKKVKYLKMWKKYKLVMDSYFNVKVNLLAGRVHDYKPELRDMVMALEGLVQKPSKMLIEVQDTFRHCAMQLGNFYHTF